MPEPPETTATTTTSKTAIRIGDVHYDIELSKIPYLSSFVSFQQNTQAPSQEFVHGPIPLFDIALKGIESGYRQCFRLLPADLAQHHTLCETYEFLCVDVLGGRSINDVIKDLKSCKSDYELEYKHYREIKGDKSKARDAAFGLLYLMLLGDLKDESSAGNKIFNAVVFIVSHSGTFKSRTRKAVRAAYEERFEVSAKQRAGLDKWNKDEAMIDSDDDRTTEEEISDDCYDSDWSM